MPLLISGNSRADCWEDAIAQSRFNIALFRTHIALFQTHSAFLQIERWCLISQLLLLPASWRARADCWEDAIAQSRFNIALFPNLEMVLDISNSVIAALIVRLRKYKGKESNHLYGSSDF